MRLLTTCFAVQRYGRPLMRIITCAPFDSNACASLEAPPATFMKSSPVARYTSMYRLPMWCLCRFNAMSLCSWDTKRINASPFRRPCGDRHKATPPLYYTHKSAVNTQRIQRTLLFLLHFETLYWELPSNSISNWLQFDDDNCERTRNHSHQNSRFAHTVEKLKVTGQSNE